MAHWRVITKAANLKFGRRLRRLRRASGLTQVQLGRRANVGWRFISEVELGNGNPSLGTMAMIAAGLGCELADLFDRGGRSLRRVSYNPAHHVETI